MELKKWPAEATALICCRVGDPQWKQQEGSQERTCYNCEHSIMVSPSTLGLIGTEPSELVCIECHREYCIASGQPTYVLPRTPMQAKEKGLDPPDRNRFIEAYVATKVHHAGAKDTPELRALASQVYDLMDEK